MKKLTLLLFSILIASTSFAHKGKINRVLERKLTAIGQNLNVQKEITVEVTFLVTETGDVILLRWSCSDQEQSETLKEKVLKSQKESKLSEGRYTHRISFKGE